MLEFANITTWLLDHGISEMVLKLIIAMSLVASIVSIARYFIGTKSYGVYAPLLLAIAYSYTGLKYGLVITTVVILTTLLSYRVLSKIRMHYITRIATNYTILSMFLILFFVIVDRFGLGLENLATIPPLAFLSIAALSDFFVKQYVKKSFMTSMTTLISTIAVASFGWLIITRGIITDYLLYNLWILPLLMLINILLGQFKGLRIKDYFRFRITKDDTSNK